MPDFLTQGDMPAILTLVILAAMLVVFLLEIYPPEVTAMGGASGRQDWQSRLLSVTAGDQATPDRPPCNTPA